MSWVGCVYTVTIQSLAYSLSRKRCEIWHTVHAYTHTAGVFLYPKNFCPRGLLFSHNKAAHAIFRSLLIFEEVSASEAMHMPAERRMTYRTRQWSSCFSYPASAKPLEEFWVFCLQPVPSTHSWDIGLVKLEEWSWQKDLTIWVAA